MNNRGYVAKCENQNLLALQIQRPSVSCIRMSIRSYPPCEIVREVKRTADPPLERRKRRYPRRCYRDDGLIRADFQGEESSAGCTADKEVNAYERGASPPVQVEESHVREARGFAPGPLQFGRERAPNARFTSPRHATPRRASSHHVSPRLAAPVGPDPFVPWDPPRHGMPLLYLPFSHFSPSARRGAASFNISRRPHPRELSSALILLGLSPPSRDYLSFSRVHPSARPLSR